MTNSTAYYLVIYICLSLSGVDFVLSGESFSMARSTSPDMDLFQKKFIPELSPDKYTLLPSGFNISHEMVFINKPLISPPSDSSDDIDKSRVGQINASVALYITNPFVRTAYNFNGYIFLKCNKEKSEAIFLFADNFKYDDAVSAYYSKNNINPDEVIIGKVIPLTYSRAYMLVNKVYESHAQNELENVFISDSVYTDGQYGFLCMKDNSHTTLKIGYQDPATPDVRRDERTRKFETQVSTIISIAQSLQNLPGRFFLFSRKSIDISYDELTKRW